jgi:glycerol 3-phosphatase-2
VRMPWSRRRTMTSAETPLAGAEVVLFDLDGVVYRGAGAIPHAVDSINSIEEARVGYLTNNASRTDVSVAEHLSELGLRVAASDVVTSPQAAVRLLAGLVPASSTILVVGGDGLTSEVKAAGFTVTRSADDAPAAVIQGFAPHVAWTDLAEAAYAMNAVEGLPWVATNTDWTIPQARGTAPGNGTLVSAVHTAVGRLPVVAGKPEVAIYEEAFARFGSREAVMVGDRLDTDILGANRSGIRSVMVLTGIDQAKQILAAVPDQRPTNIVDDLRALHAPYAAASTENTSDGAVTTAGDAVVRRRGSVLSVERGSGVELLRAGSAAIWDSGLPIYGLEVPPELYS